MLQRHTLNPPDIGLRSADLDQPAWSRRRNGEGWRYFDADDKALTGAQRAQCEALAVPPAWQNVWISSNSKTHILAIGDDAAGRRQYIYHPDWRAAREAVKFADLPRFADGLPSLRRRVRRMLGSNEPEVLSLASILRLLDQAGLRIGHPRRHSPDPAIGVTTLAAEHVDVQGEDVALEFTAKGGKPRDVTLRDRALADALQTLSEQTDDDEDYLFETEHGRCSARRVNAFLEDVMGERFSAKDFRTWGGSVAAASIWRKDPSPTIKALSEAASDWLGNTPAIARNSYIHPAIIAASQSGGPRPGPAGPTRLRKDERFCYAVIRTKD